MKKVLLAMILVLCPLSLFANNGNDNFPCPGNSCHDDGTIVQNGKDGTNGTNGLNGLNGLNGKDGANYESDSDTSYYLDTEVRLADSQYLQLVIGNSYNWGQRQNEGFHMKFIFKLGESYEERQIKELKTLLQKVQYELENPSARTIHKGR